MNLQIKPVSELKKNNVVYLQNEDGTYSNKKIKMIISNGNGYFISYDSSKQDTIFYKSDALLLIDSDVVGDDEILISKRLLTLHPNEYTSRGRYYDNANVYKIYNIAKEMCEKKLLWVTDVQPLSEDVSITSIIGIVNEVKYNNYELEFIIKPFTDKKDYIVNGNLHISVYGEAFHNLNETYSIKEGYVDVQRVICLFMGDN